MRIYKIAQDELHLWNHPDYQEMCSLRHGVHWLNERIDLQMELYLRVRLSSFNSLDEDLLDQLLHVLNVMERKIGAMKSGSFAVYDGSAIRKAWLPLNQRAQMENREPINTGPEEWRNKIIEHLRKQHEKDDRIYNINFTDEYIYDRDYQDMEVVRLNVLILSSKIHSIITDFVDRRKGFSKEMLDEILSLVKSIKVFIEGMKRSGFGNARGDLVNNRRGEKHATG